MNRQDYLDQNAAAGYRAPVPELLEDSDGVPLAVAPSDAEWNYVVTVVTVAELARVGLTPEDVPNLKILRPRRKDTP